MAMGMYGAYVELLDMAARVAARTYAHLPQTSRTYYRPPPTTTTAATTSNGGASPRASERSFEGEAEASSARRNHQQQQAPAIRVAFDATEIIFSGVV